MRSAAVLILASIIGIAIYIRFGRHPKPAEVRPQTSPPSISQPLSPFEDDYEVAKNEKDRVVILVFTSEWCPHCVRLKEHLKKSNLDGLLFCFIDATKKTDLVGKYKVKKLPTSVMLKKGKETARKVGFLKGEYDEWLSSNR
jgi:thiol-disulfide isomerase/thioredoxin